MSRIEENRTVIKTMNSLIEKGIVEGNELLVSVLVDISKSLAVIADALERRAEDERAD